MEHIDKDSAKNESIGKQIREWAIYIISLLAISFLLRTFVFGRANVDGRSMESTLFDKDVIFVEKLSLLTGKIKRGEIVIFNANNANKDIYVKRVIAVEGDEVQIKDGKVFLNGKQLEEDYLDKNVVTNPGSFMTKDKIYKVEKNHVFVLGDNREHSKDSRDIGPIDIKDIEGHAVLKVYPFKQFRVF